MENGLITMIKSFIQVCFIECNNIEKMFEKLNPYLKTINDPLIMAREIFLFLFFLLKNNLISKPSKIFKYYFKSSALSNLLQKTDISDMILQMYNTFPPKSIYYYILIHVFQNNQEKKIILMNSVKNDFNKLFNEGQELKEEKIIIFFKIITKLFDSSTTSEKWTELYFFIYDNFSNFIRYISKSEYYLNALNFVSHITTIKNSDKSHLPANNPFPTYQPHSLFFFKFFIELLINCTENIIKSNNENDYMDDFLSIILSTNNLLISPFPNYGILELYDDKCVFNLMNLIITVTKSNIKLIHEYPNIIYGLIRTANIMVEYFINITINTKEYFNFILQITKICLLTQNNQDKYEEIFHPLYLLIQNIEDESMIYEFFHHFILAMNLIINNEIPSFEEEQSSPIEGFFYYFNSKTNLKYLNQINLEIIEDQSNKERKEIYLRACENVFFPDLFDGSKDNELKFCFEITNIFQKDIRILSLKMEYLPHFSKYFVL